MNRVLFLTYDGPEQRYLQSLFMPIFARVRDAGFSFDIIQLTWGAHNARVNAAEWARKLGIRYTPLRILRRLQPLSTACTLTGATAYVAHYVRRHGITVVLARSILPAAIAMFAASRARPLTFAFDADGLPADERVEFAGWSPTGAYYRIYRAIENQALLTADVVITRTQAARRILLSRAGAGMDAKRITVIPNAKDECIFHSGDVASRLAVRAQLGVSATAPWIVFAGGLGPQYHPARLFDFFERVLRRRSDARLLILTGHPAVAEQLLASRQLPRGSVRIASLPADAVARHLAAADVGIAFREPSFSQQAVSPIKVAEYLLCGLPVLGTRGIGDLDGQLSQNTALLLPTLGPEDLEQAAEWFVERVLPEREAFRRSARLLGEQHFALGPCAARYAKALSVGARCAH